MVTQIFALLLLIQPFFITQPPTGAVFRSADGGSTWQDLSAGLPGEVQAMDVYAWEKEILLASEAGLFRLDASFVAPTWRKEILHNGPVRGFMAGKTGPYAYCEKGVYQVFPGSGMWLPVYPNLDGGLILADLETPGGGLLVATDKGIFKSADGGKSWRKVFSEEFVNSLVAADGALIGGGVKGVLRSTDQGEHWTWAFTKEEMVLETALAWEGIVVVTLGSASSSDSTMTALSANASKEINNRLLYSADGGKIWTYIDKGLPPARKIYEIAQVGEVLFCSLETGLFRSSDRGKTWSLALASKGEGRFELAVSGRSVIAVWAPGLDGC
ncbi:MAG: hypothetical protein WA004_12280 [Saprospiraceae bacterium]